MRVYHCRVVAQERRPVRPGKGPAPAEPALVYYLDRGAVGRGAPEELLYCPRLPLVPGDYHLPCLDQGQALSPAELLHEPVAPCRAFGPKAPRAVVDAGVEDAAHPAGGVGPGGLLLLDDGYTPDAPLGELSGEREPHYPRAAYTH